MYINVLGRGETTLPAGWGDELSISVLGDARIDATAPFGEGARLTVVTVLCSATVLVPEGAQIELSGGDILGGHSIDVEPSPDGPSIRLQAIPTLGKIKIKSE